MIIIYLFMLWLFHFKRNPFHSPPNIFVRHLKHKIQPPNTFSEVVLANDSGDLHKVRKGMYMCVRVCRHVKDRYIYIYAYHFQVSISFMLCEMGSTFEYCQALSCQSDDVAYPSLTYSWWYVADCCFSGRNSAPNGKYFYRWIRSIHPIESQKTIIQK